MGSIDGSGLAPVDYTRSERLGAEPPSTISDNDKLTYYAILSMILTLLKKDPPSDDDAKNLAEALNRLKKMMDDNLLPSDLSALAGQLLAYFASNMAEGKYVISKDDFAALSTATLNGKSLAVYAKELGEIVDAATKGDKSTSFIDTLWRFACDVDGRFTLAQIDFKELADLLDKMGKVNGDLMDFIGRVTQSAVAPNFDPSKATRYSDIPDWIKSQHSKQYRIEHGMQGANDPDPPGTDHIFDDVARYGLNPYLNEQPNYENVINWIHDARANIYGLNDGKSGLEHMAQWTVDFMDHAFAAAIDPPIGGADVLKIINTIQDLQRLVDELKAKGAPSGAGSILDTAQQLLDELKTKCNLVNVQPGDTFEVIGDVIARNGAYWCDLSVVKGPVCAWLIDKQADNSIVQHNITAATSYSTSSKNELDSKRARHDSIMESITQCLKTLSDAIKRAAQGMQ